MSMSMQALFTKLRVDPKKPNEEGITRLREYCQTNISRDRLFEGTLEQRFDGYLNLAKLYIEVVLPNLDEDDIDHEIEAFSNQSTLEYLVRNGFDRCIERLNPSPEDLNQFFGLMSPLHIAAAKGYLHMTEVLLQLGANPGIVNAQKELPIHHVLRLPVFYKEKLPELKQEIFIKLFKRMPQCIAFKTYDGQSVVHQMATYGFKELLERVIEQQPDSVLMTDNRGLMPVHSAILNNQPELVKLLITNSNANEMLDSKKRNPLHYAASDGVSSMISLCLEGMSIKIDATDKYQTTPLMLAADTGKLDNVSVLLELGADPNLKDHHGITALDMALNHFHLDVADLLIANMESVTDDQRQKLVSIRSNYSNN